VRVFRARATLRYHHSRHEMPQVPCDRLTGAPILVLALPPVHQVVPLRSLQPEILRLQVAAV